jgi:hypothetical protein
VIGVKMSIKDEKCNEKEHGPESEKEMINKARRKNVMIRSEKIEEKFIQEE